MKYIRKYMCCMCHKMYDNQYEAEECCVNSEYYKIYKRIISVNFPREIDRTSHNLYLFFSVRLDKLRELLNVCDSDSLEDENFRKELSEQISKTARKVKMYFYQKTKERDIIESKYL